MIRIAVTTGSFGEYDKKPLELLKEKGLEVSLNPYGRKIKKEEIGKLCKGAAGIIAGTESIDADTMKGLAGLKVISRCGAGLDNVDLDAAKKLGIKVFNTPDAPTGAVAELTVCLILNILRKVSQMDAAVKGNKWEQRMGNLLSGKKVGIVGFGRIGRNVASLLESFGCEIAYYDPFTEDRASGFKKMPFHDLLKWSSIVSIHASGDTRLIGKDEIRLMNRGAWLINTSRGEAIDESALCDALRDGHIKGAALDVFESEPYSGPLKGMDNVVLTPHIGSYAVEARVKMEMDSAINLLKGLDIRA